MTTCLLGNADHGPDEQWADRETALTPLGLYEKGKAAHALRHSYAVQLYRQQKDLRAVQKQFEAQQRIHHHEVRRCFSGRLAGTDQRTLELKQKEQHHGKETAGQKSSNAARASRTKTENSNQAAAKAEAEPKAKKQKRQSNLELGRALLAEKADEKRSLPLSQRPTEWQAKRTWNISKNVQLSTCE